MTQRTCKCVTNPTRDVILYIRYACAVEWKVNCSVVLTDYKHLPRRDGVTELLPFHINEHGRLTDWVTPLDRIDQGQC